MSYSLQDHQYMARAIQLARKGRFTTTPNPNVGCVLVKDGNIIGQGWHQKAGTGHAEVNALQDLSVAASIGATAYVTLEPCSHFGRTPPCALRLIEAKVARVVIAMLDPNPKVAGQGVAKLEAAGIRVDTGLLEVEARRLNPGFLTRMEQKRPFVQLKLASSIDGKTALANGESKWITSGAARADVQQHRAEACAIISTAQTVLADDARLDVRSTNLNFDYPQSEHIKDVRQPVRIILDGGRRITQAQADKLALFQTDGPIYLVRSDSNHTSLSRHTSIGQESKTLAGAHVVTLPYDAGKGFDLQALLNWCHQQDWGKVWVEAGATLAASFVQQGLFDELILYQAPKILGKNGREALPIGPFTSMSEVHQLSLNSTRQLGDDIKFTFGRN